MKNYKFIAVSLFLILSAMAFSQPTNSEYAMANRIDAARVELENNVRILGELAEVKDSIREYLLENAKYTKQLLVYQKQVTDSNYRSGANEPFKMPILVWTNFVGLLEFKRELTYELRASNLKLRNLTSSKHSVKKKK